MKTNFLLAIAIAAMTSLTTNAQPQRMQPYSGKSPQEMRQVMRSGKMSMPKIGLDDKQREELKKIHAQQLKERTQTRNLLREKRAKLEVLQTADKPDMKEVNKAIDEIATVLGQEMKNMAANRQKIRSVLTDEQRAFFDAHAGNRENGRHEWAGRFKGQSGGSRQFGQNRQFGPWLEHFRDQRMERSQKQTGN